MINKNKSIVLRGDLLDLSTPIVMAIVNVTDDSFYSKSRSNSKAAILNSVKTAIENGASIIDVGGYSTRPNAAFVDENSELERVCFALEIIRKQYPEVYISVDTFRAKIIDTVVKTFSVDMINDISGGTLDHNMLETVVSLNIPYVLMHIKGTPQNMHQMTEYKDFIPEIMQYFATKIETLRDMGFTSDIVIDPGFGFAKTLEQNYTLLANMQLLECFNAPILSGISRKSMINKVIETTPEEALNGTTVLNTLSLVNGADILRVHDVKEAVQAIELYKKYSDRIIKNNHTFETHYGL